MEKFVILSRESYCRKKEGGRAKALSQDIDAFYHSDYHGGGSWKEPGSIENMICTLKNDITKYSHTTLFKACDRLTTILWNDLPDVLIKSRKYNLRVCVIPRSKCEVSYEIDQLIFRDTIQSVVQGLNGFIDGTHDIIRHTDTATTHLRYGDPGSGEFPYIGITKDTCNISDNVIGQDILLIDDLYTKTVNIDEDCIQALLDKGAKSVIFYSIGKTVPHF